jgi:fibronectin-binding autotransporter adhesin
MNRPSASYRVSLPWIWQPQKASLVTFICRWLAVVALGFFATSASAQVLAWDPSSNGGNPPASGNWDTATANWYNGSADVIWSQTSGTVPTTGAIFGGADGTYAINVATQIAATNIMVNNSGYTFSGSGIFLENSASTPGINVAAGKTVTLACPIASGNNANYFLVGAGSVLNFQNTMNSVQAHFLGAGTVNLSSSISPNVVYVDCGNLNFTSGTWVQGTGGVLYVGYSTAYGGVTSTTGTLTVNGGTINDTGNKIVVVRGGGTGTLTLNSGAINVWTAASGSVNANAIISIPNNDNSADHASLNVNGGVLTLGNSLYAAKIELMPGGSAAASQAFLNQTGGHILAYGGITFGGSSGTFSGGIAALTNSGGSLYLGGNGISLGALHALTNYIALSGGTVGALANWSSVMPMTLGTLNGNITFQCADNNNASWNISLSGPLTGPGGLNVVGGGTLTLSGTNFYTGSTIVSNGTLALVTSPYVSTNGSSMTVDGSAGAPTFCVQSSPGQAVSTGPLVFQNGSTTLSNSFGVLAPSTSVAPIQISGGVNFATTPIVTISGTAIATGIYPLVTCTGGTISGTAPKSVTITLTGGSALGYLTNTATTLSLVVTNSTYNPADYWRVGSGAWDIQTTANWYQFINSNHVTYTNGSAVVFDGTAAGPFPVTVTDNVSVSPNNITFNSPIGDNYTLTGTGSIIGPGSLSLLGSGTVTLTETNTYSGGTTLSAGQLNINNGGDSSGQDSAIGTGPLTINGGAIDNTGGSNITLIPSIAETWNGNFSYLGSTNNFDIGAGTVTFTENMVLTVISNTFEVDGSINDGGNGLGITKAGGGTLTLTAGNSFFGDFELGAGQLNIGTAGALGYGNLIIDGGSSIDNSSGGLLTLNSGPSGGPDSYRWAGNFSYLGTSNSLNLGSGTVNVTLPGNMTLNVVSNTLVTAGSINAGNTTVHKTGLGIWDIQGDVPNSSQILGLSIDQGTVLFDKIAGFVVNHPIGLLVQSNALVYETGIGGPTQPEVNPAYQVTLSTGGVWDLNGQSEAAGAFTDSNGVLRNSSINGISGFTNNVVPSTITGTNCVFDVTNSGAVLNIATVLSGSGSLVETGSGLVDLLYTNTYTGNTTVNGGTLELNAPCLTNTVAINTNAVLNLNFTGTDQIAALSLGGTNQPPGLYNATTTPGLITGTGSLQVGTPSSLTYLAFTAGPVVSGTSLSISVTNSGAGTAYVLTTTNLTAPLNTWMPIWTNVSSGSGSYTSNLLNTVNPAVNQQFFILSSTNE